jgi:hypothetical protein
MTEYKYVSLPTTGREVRSEDVARYASEELNRLCAAEGWEVVNATRPASIGPIGFLLRKG